MVAAENRRAVEIAIAALDQPADGNSTLMKEAVERVQHRNGTSRSDSKYCPFEKRTPGGSRAIEIAVRALHQSADWDRTLAGKPAKRMKRGQAAGCIDLENRSLVMRATERRRAIKVPIAPLHQHHFRRQPIASVKRVQSGQCLG